MSLKKKIALSFFISAFVIAILAAIEYVNFIEIRKEIRYLEITDTIRSKSLQLRRHEKNFFLYSPQKSEKESAAVRSYIDELKEILRKNSILDERDKTILQNSILEYERRFLKIDVLMKDLSSGLARPRNSYNEYYRFYPLLELTYLERPLEAADFLEKVFLLPRDHALIKGLRDLDADINLLRKNGEDILTVSKELDRIARGKVESVIRFSQVAILIIFPLFLVFGIVMLFITSGNVVKRLKVLTALVERTGKGDFAHMSLSSRGQNDEVGTLIRKFNTMENQLAEREEELESKNRELLQTKKLAAIGTLASGVAHELNNPLNNIYLSAQVLSREAGDACSPVVKDAVGDIMGQTERVKSIVGALLEFARGREPQAREVELGPLVSGAWRMLGRSMDIEKVRFTADPSLNGLFLFADPEQMERVFINLFSNAVEAMKGDGELKASARRDGDGVLVTISDTGPGIPPEAVDKIFEPFFTTKDKGTGLGLAIVFNIVRKHRGEITVSSEKGKGTLFLMKLPGRNV